jgi:hypothetical protein
MALSGRDNISSKPASLLTSSSGTRSLLPGLMSGGSKNTGSTIAGKCGCGAAPPCWPPDTCRRRCIRGTRCDQPGQERRADSRRICNTMAAKKAFGVEPWFAQYPSTRPLRKFSASDFSPEVTGDQDGLIGPTETFPAWLPRLGRSASGAPRCLRLPY